MSRGRPSLIHDATIRSNIKTALLQGADWQTAAAFAGITPQALRSWRLRAKKALEEMEEGGEREGKRPLKKDLPYIEFYKELQKVRSTGEVTLLNTLNKMAAGGVKVRKTKEVEYMIPKKDDNGIPTGEMEIVKVTREVSEEELPPNAPAAKTLLQFSYGYAERSEVSGPNGGPIETETSVQMSVDEYKEKLAERSKQAAEALHQFDEVEEGDA